MSSSESLFSCSICGQPYTLTQCEYTCRHCGPTGILEPVCPERDADDLFTASPGMWRYERLLALSPTVPRPPLPVGGTPLVKAPILGARLGLSRLFVKNEAVNPTGSLKDRASAAVLARAAKKGVASVAVASTGNAGSSLAGLAASMGIPAVIFVPANAPKAKLLQTLMYGARVFAVRGTYDDAFDLCLEASTRFGWYNRNTAYNPLTIEGKKTVSFEIYEQLGNQAPDLVLVPTGDGCILSGVARGFRDLHALGLIERVPRLIAVQAQGADAFARLVAGDVRNLPAASVADSITVRIPRNGPLAARDLNETGGRVVVVPDEAILAAMAELAATTGIYAEPAAAASLAGLRALLDEECIAPTSTIVLLATGSGLKDVAAAVRAAPDPISIDPDLTEVEKFFSARR